MLNLKITLKRCKSQLPTFKAILPQFSGYIIKLLAYLRRITFDLYSNLRFGTGLEWSLVKVDQNDPRSEWPWSKMTVIPALEKQLASQIFANVFLKMLEWPSDNQNDRFWIKSFCAQI